MMLTLAKVLAIASVTFSFACHHEQHRPDPAFAASCSTDGVQPLLDGDGVVRVDPHWKPTNKHGGDDHEVRGADVHVATKIQPATLESALRCHAARVDREASSRGEGPLEVSVKMPKISVKQERAGTVIVVIEAESERDGKRVLASAKALPERASAKAATP